MRFLASSCSLFTSAAFCADGRRLVCCFHVFSLHVACFASRRGAERRSESSPRQVFVARPAGVSSRSVGVFVFLSFFSLLAPRLRRACVYCVLPAAFFFYLPRCPIGGEFPSRGFSLVSFLLFAHKTRVQRSEAQTWPRASSKRNGEESELTVTERTTEDPTTSTRRLGATQRKKKKVGRSFFFFGVALGLFARDQTKFGEAPSCVRRVVSARRCSAVFLFVCFWETAVRRRRPKK